MITERPVALVTGGARRVGLAICRSLARSGCDIELTYNKSAVDAAAAGAQLAELGARVRTHQLDLTQPDSVLDFAARRAADLPRLDVLVHNASAYGPTPLQALDADDALTHYRVNALAPLLLSAGLSDRLSRSPLPGGGAIVALADIHAMGRPRRDHAAYQMSKAALVEMVHSLARDLAPRVRVNGVAPGVVDWPESGLDADPDTQRRYISRIPLARSGTPEDAAEAVRWLALDAHYTTGEVIRVDGGRWLT